MISTPKPALLFVCPEPAPTWRRDRGRLAFLFCCTQALSVGGAEQGL